MTLEELLDIAEDNPKPSRILPEAAIMRMREFSEAYSKGNSFAIGDLVTPRMGGL